MASVHKSPDAFRTIGELSAELGVPQHVLRYWETKFPQLRPLQRAGNRRYYRPAEVALTRRIHHLLNEQGYTVRGVQKLLSEKGDLPASDTIAPPAPVPNVVQQAAERSLDVERLVSLRDRLNAALAA